jgi:hypothetical protein
MVQKGIKLVFGEDGASLGYICGIKDAIVHDKKSLPDYYCQLDPDEWGFAGSFGHMYSLFLDPEIPNVLCFLGCFY